jgi:hypothetical protein
MPRGLMSIGTGRLALQGRSASRAPARPRAIPTDFPDLSPSPDSGKSSEVGRPIASSEVGLAPFLNAPIPERAHFGALRM